MKRILTKTERKLRLNNAALEAASCARGVRTLRRLFGLGVSVNVRDDDGWTLLMLAAAFGNLAVVRFLVGRGAYLHAKDPSSLRTAAHAAAFNGHLDVLGFLEKAGANPAGKDRDGHTAKGYLTGA